MNPFRNFYNMRHGIVDLSLQSADIVSLNPEVIETHVGGVAMNRVLLQQYNNSLILGTGPLTGSFAPSSSVMMATFISPLFNQISHVPFMLRSGPALKFSGIDFLTIQGIARELSLIHVNENRIRVLPAHHLRSLPIELVMRTLKKEFPHHQSSLITGPAADHMLIHATVSIGNWGSLDKAGMALVMASKNLKAIVFDGTGGIPFEKNNHLQGKELLEKISQERNFKKRGFSTVYEMNNNRKAVEISLKKAKKKDFACYHCPSPCMTWATLPGGTTSVLLLDHLGFATLSRKTGRHTLHVFHRCLQMGCDPVAVAYTLSEEKTLEDWLRTIEKMLTETERDDNHVKDFSPFSKVPVENHILWGGGLIPLPPFESWSSRVGLAMILGICPLFLLRFPTITEGDLLKFLPYDEPSLSTCEERVKELITTTERNAHKPTH